MNPKQRLLKDLPGYKARTVFRYVENPDDEKTYGPDGWHYYISPDTLTFTSSAFRDLMAVLLNTPGWFEEVQPDRACWETSYETDTTIEVVWKKNGSPYAAPSDDERIAVRNAIKALLVVLHDRSSSATVRPDSEAELEKRIIQALEYFQGGGDAN